ncbi:hydroxyacylglutathione hydrolase [Pseudomonas sp. NFACC52]|nr:hydroxyacylglutathione hydrolase [Pseudomonas sp. NFACC56-3]SFK88115.1 hydroxyacylglutathione hydrolase [Pseudomonas sp. NFACC52]
MLDEIFGVRAFADNYIWLLRKGTDFIVVDPGVAAPVRAAIEARQGKLAAILITHHHQDHVGGVADLLGWQSVPVYGPAAEAIDCVDCPVTQGDHVHVEALDATFDVIDVGGHTLGHIAYRTGNALFCGDTLFAGGCGRIFEGTPEQMWHSLNRLAMLPHTTQVYCAHEYTEANLRFALAVEPDNQLLKDRWNEVQALRAQDQPTVPSTIGLELLTNPFLRARHVAVVDAAEAFQGHRLHEEVAVFAALREWKNVF